MKVEIKVLPEAKEPYAVIYASEITPEIRRAAALLETKNSGVVSVMENERIIVLRPDEIYMVRVENEKTVVYTKTKRYDGGKRLYEFEEILGKWVEPKAKSFSVGEKVIIHGFDTQMFVGEVLECTDKVKVNIFATFYEKGSYEQIEAKQVQYELTDYHVKSLQEYIEKRQKEIDEQLAVVDKLLEI